MITAIFANAALRGRPAASGAARCIARPLTNAILEDARPSDGVFASLTNCLESPPAPSRTDRKKTTSAVFHLLPVLFRCTLPASRFHAAHGECFGNTCLENESASARTEAGEKCNPLRIQRAAAPELSGIRAGWRCTAPDRVARCPAAGRSHGPARGPGLEQIPQGIRGPGLIPPPD